MSQRVRTSRAGSIRPGRRPIAGRSVTTRIGPLQTMQGRRAMVRASVCGPRARDCERRVLSRHSSAAAAGIRMSTSPRRAPSSDTWTARLGRYGLLTLPAESGGLRSRHPRAFDCPRACLWMRFPRRTRWATWGERSSVADLCPPLCTSTLHDTDLLDLRRRTTIGVLFPLLARRVKPTDLDTLAGATLEAAPNVAWDDVARL